MMSKAKHKQAGVSMLEVLVAILVLSLGLLGLGGLQATGLRNSYSAYLRAQAAQFAFDMTDRMRANRAAAISGQYDLAMNASAPAGSTLPDKDRAEWLALLGNLPSGDGSISVSNNGTARIVVQWNDRRSATDQTEAATLSTTQLVVDTRI